MCGILGVIFSSLQEENLRERALRLSRRLRHRGPDWNGIHLQKLKSGKLNVFAHERLAIVHPESGQQPLFNKNGNLCVTVNGEIYNYVTLAEALHTSMEDEDSVTAVKSMKSDCEVIPYLYEKYGPKMVVMLDGIFAFVLADEKTGEFLAARDPFGVCPLYIGYATDGSLWFASEMKALIDDCCHIEVFPPGCYMTEVGKSFNRYYKPVWMDAVESIKFNPLSSAYESRIMSVLEAAVEKRFMTDVPYGVLLSGGLDSSCIASVVKRKFDEMQRKSVDSPMAFKNVHTFSIGMKGAPDLLAAHKVAEFLGTTHHEFTYDLQDGLNAIRDVIWHLESYDVTTIRAATPLYILMRLVKSLGIKMVFSGEGADEILGGYLYFAMAPSSDELFKETVRKINDLHLYDLLRANKASMAWGVELRVPFMDKAFVETLMQLDPREKLHTKGRIEKWVLRRLFSKYLPESIVWRQKEQFSDGVGYGWINGLQKYAEDRVSDYQLSLAASLFPVNSPRTKEEYLYRQIFYEHFPHGSADKLVPGGPSIACSTAAAIEWHESFRNNADQSGRAVIGVHKDSRKF